MSSIFKYVSFLMTTSVLFFSLPNVSTLGAMNGTSEILDAALVAQMRYQLKQFLAHEAAQNQFAVRGITSLQAEALIDSLSDAETLRIAARIENLPTGAGGGFLLGGGAWGVIGIAMIVTVVILLITDLLGYTDYFDIR